jgi:lysophospholipase L1-like esterase
MALDATPILAADKDPAALFLSDAGHLSARGHEVVAAWLARELATAWR